MAFMKASPEQAYVKMGMYGPAGAGKTYTALLWAEGLAGFRGKRVAYIDTERGTDFYAKVRPGDPIHPEAFDFDAVYTRSLAEVLQEVKGLDPEVHGVIVIDSISHLWEAAIDAYSGRMVGRGGSNIPMNAWGPIKKPYKELISLLMASPFDVFILGRQKNIFEQEGGELKKVGVGMKAEGETAHEPHICLRMEGLVNNKGDRPIVWMYPEKDRTSTLAVTKNPTFGAIEALLPLLGDTQASGEDLDERQALDGELLAEEEERQAKKLTKSEGLLTEFQARYLSVTALADLGGIVADLKKKKRYLEPDHLNALREMHRVRSEQLREAEDVPW